MHLFGTGCIQVLWNTLQNSLQRDMGVKKGGAAYKTRTCDPRITKKRFHELSIYFLPCFQIVMPLTNLLQTLKHYSHIIHILGFVKDVNMSKRCAIYSRVSTHEQTTSNQIMELKEIVARRGLTIFAESSDEGISGAKGRDTNDHRQERRNNQRLFAKPSTPTTTCI